MNNKKEYRTKTFFFFFCSRIFTFTKKIKLCNSRERKKFFNDENMLIKQKLFSIIKELKLHTKIMAYFMLASFRIIPSNVQLWLKRKRQRETERDEKKKDKQKL